MARKSRRSVSRAISPREPAELDAGRPATDQHERHPLASPLRIGFPFRGLERDEDPPPDLDGVLEGLQALGVLRPVVVPEVRVVGAGRHDERVVADRPAVRDLDLALVDIDADGLAEDDRGVALPRQHGAQRLGDVPRGEGAGRDLVEHRLEEVEVAAVDRVTATSGSLRRFRAAYRPANPPPTIRTRCRVRSGGDAVTPRANRQDPALGLRRRPVAVVTRPAAPKRRGEPVRSG